MLYSTFCKMKIEAGEADDFEVKSRTCVGNLMEITLTLRFFSEPQPSQSLTLRPEFFRRLLLNIVENSYTAHILSNLNFVLVQKYLGDYINDEMDKSKKIKNYGSPFEMKTRFAVEKIVEPYSMITFVFKKETDLFLAWNQHLSDQGHSNKTSDFVPKAKLEVTFTTQNADSRYQLSLTEDVINRARDGGRLQSESHMQHVQGNWNTDKIYWINFHQARSEITQIE